MLAYHSDPAIKRQIIDQLEAHRAADQLVKGRYWERGKGCAVGCTIHSGQHAEYETRFGIPRHLAYLEDRLFESLPNELAMAWPTRFMAAIRPGADLTQVWAKFAVFLMSDSEFGVLRFAKTEKQKSIIREVAALYECGEKDVNVWQDVRNRAWNVRADADAAAYATAYAATAAYATAAYATATAAYATAAYATADAADAAAYATAADAAADATADAATAYATAAGDALPRAASGGSASQAAASARRKHIEAQADKLIDLLQAAR